MKIRCIALDLDHTTLDDAGRLSPENRAALEDAIRQGVHVIIASGRAFSSLPAEVTDVAGIEYAITSNGAAVYHLPTGRCLRRVTLAPDSVKEILRLTAGEPVVYEGFVDGAAYADASYVRDPVGCGAPAQAVSYIRRTRRPVADMPAFLLENAHQLDSVDVVVRSQADKARLRARLSAMREVYVTSSVPQLIEIAHRDAGKHTGVRFVAELLGLPREAVAAFGDGDNDADMLADAGYGVAVANASPACLAAADFVTAHCREDGVALGIRRLLERS